jgi:hypothetical protein
VLLYIYIYIYIYISSAAELSCEVMDTGEEENYGEIEE